MKEKFSNRDAQIAITIMFLSTVLAACGQRNPNATPTDDWVTYVCGVVECCGVVVPLVVLGALFRYKMNQRFPGPSSEKEEKTEE